MVRTHDEQEACVRFEEDGRSCLDVTEQWEFTREKQRTLSLLEAALESTADGFSRRRPARHHQRVQSALHDHVWRFPRPCSRAATTRGRSPSSSISWEEPGGLLRRVRELYGQTDVESFDVIPFKDGRVFERYSQPQSIGRETVGRVFGASAT